MWIGVAKCMRTSNGGYKISFTLIMFIDIRINTVNVRNFVWNAFATICSAHSQTNLCVFVYLLSLTWRFSFHWQYQSDLKCVPSYHTQKKHILKPILWLSEMACNREFEEQMATFISNCLPIPLNVRGVVSIWQTPFSHTLMSHTKTDRKSSLLSFT